VASKVDPVAIVEAAYQLEGDERSWLREIIEGARRSFDRGMGLYALTYHLDGQHAMHPETVFADDGEWLEAAIRKINREMPPDRVKLMYFSPRTLMTLSDIARIRPDILDAFEPEAYHRGIRDALALNAKDPSGVGVLVGASLPREMHVSKKESQRWGYITAHIAAGLRLRRALAAGGVVGEDAVLAPDGRCLHAEELAKAKSVRERLRGAVVAMDRARGGLRRKDPEEALEIWRALVSGRWSLVDHFDSDGKRLLVARRNEPELKDPRALSRRERQVAAYVAQGQSNKLIAYTLGLSISTVASHLASAMRKMGIGSRVEFVRTFAVLLQSSSEDP
jgi:DNA-binding CsgD family transcriptional regulator